MNTSTFCHPLLAALLLAGSTHGASLEGTFASGHAPDQSGAFSLLARGDVQATLQSVAPVLTGHWQGQIAGQTVALTLRADGGGLLDGQPIRYQAAGSMLLIERQGQVTQYAYELRDGLLLVAGGDLPGVLVLQPGAAPEQTPATQPPSPGQAGNPRDLLGQWCKASSGNTSAGGWFSQYCFTLHADGSYEYFSTSDRSVHTTSIDGRLTGQVLDAGRWTVTGPSLTAQSRSGRVTNYGLQRSRNPRNGEAQLCLDGDCYGAMRDARRW